MKMPTIEDGDWKTLYETSGDIRDFNTLLVNRNDFREALKAYGELVRQACLEVHTPQSGVLIAGVRIKAVPTDYTEAKPVPKCACCGTTKNLHRDLGSGGPYRCDSEDCMVY